MIAAERGYDRYSFRPGGSPYFDLKATLHLLITEKRWTSLKLAAEDMLAVYPQSAMAWFSLGLAQLKQGFYTDAVTNLKKALYHNPDMVSVSFQLGIASYYQKEYTKAILYYEEALRKGMNTHYLHYNMANAWLKIHHHDAAIKAYLRSLSICHEFTPAAYGLFRVYFVKHDYQNAVSALRPVISDERLPHYLFAQAKLLYQNEPEINNHKLREAHRLLSCAIDLDADFAQAYYERAYINSKLNDLSGFARDRNTAFGLSPQLSQGHVFNLFSSYYL
jgi:tetratricopeptide (TPR) repeat protein